MNATDYLAALVASLQEKVAALAAKEPPAPPAGTPSGSILAYGGGTAPTGFLECNGAAVSRTTYAALFTAIGTNWGSGDGSTTFNLPDLRGLFPRGWDHAAARDPDRASRTALAAGGATGDNVGSYEGAAALSHTHNFTVQRAGVGTGVAVGGDGTGATGTQTTTAPSAGGGNETRPVNVNVMYIVKT